MLAGSGTCTTLRSALICANSLVVVPGVKVTVTNSVREYGLPLNIVPLLALCVPSLRVVVATPVLVPPVLKLTLLAPKKP
jgi:hypothetical protein